MIQRENFFSLISKAKEEEEPSIFCKDDFSPDVTEEQTYYSQVRRFLQTAKKDGEDGGASLPEGADYLLVTLIGKDMLSRSNKSEWASMITGITIAFRTLTPIPIGEVGVEHRKQLNQSIYNMRNKLLMEWFNGQGVWSLVNNNVSVNKQYDKIQHIKLAIQFESKESSHHDIYLLKTVNLVKQIPSHYILLINKHCFHLTNVGVFSGQYRRMKCRIFDSVTNFEKVGSTNMDLVEIDLMCQVLADQSHSLLFNNCQNYAQSVYNCICQDKGVRVELSSFSGARVIIQCLLGFVLALLALVVALYINIK